MSEKPRLKRVLGLGTMTLFTVGTILGAGIYALIGINASLCGPMMWLPFLLGSVYSISIGLGYAEMASMFPKAGASYVYVERGFETISPRLARFISFILAWNVIFFAIPMAVAAITLAFGSYLSIFVDIPPILAALVSTILLSVVNWIGVKESAVAAVIMTLVEVTGLVLVIAFGLFFGSVRPDYLTAPPGGMEGLIRAFAMVLFTYGGYEAMVSLAEEAKNPEKTIPKAIMLGISTVTILYVGVSLTVTRLAPIQAIAGSTSPIADAMKGVFGGAAVPLFSFIGCFATLNTALAWLVANSRTMYGMAVEGVLPTALARLDAKRSTPWVTITVTTIITLACTLIGEVEIIVYGNMIASLLLTAVGCISLVILRVRAPDKPRPFKVPLAVRNIPIPIVACIPIAVFIVLSLPIVSWIPFLITLTIGALLYPVLSRRTAHPQIRQSQINKS
jgi:APA family basic amino acid/polyamine antiporter